MNILLYILAYIFIMILLIGSTIGWTIIIKVLWTKKYEITKK